MPETLIQQTPPSMPLTGRRVLVSGHDEALGAASIAAMRAAGATAMAAGSHQSPSEAVDGFVRAHGALDVVHLTGTAGATEWCRAAGEALAERAGVLITTVSLRAMAGDTTDMAEGAAGGAVIALTRMVATAFGRRGVRANCIAVPPTDIPADTIQAHLLIPRGYRPQDAAMLAVFLASDDASFVTGQLIPCDGGQMAHLPHYASLMAAGATTAG